jgi:hypothetical protein
MSSQVGIDEIETTRSEKLLAVVLAVFFLIGGIWVYSHLDNVVEPGRTVGTPAERAAIEQARTARVGRQQAQQRELRALRDLELSREAYRTALDAGEPAGDLRRRYEQDQADLERAQARAATAQEAELAARPAANKAQRRIGEASNSETRRAELIAFFLRLAFVLGTLLAGYWLLGRLRKRQSRYLPLAYALVGFTALQALVMAGDYLTDYIDPLDLGPLVLSIFGIAATLVAFAALQRYLARRVPARRVRKHECPFCGYPVRKNQRCEGCGRDVVAECTTCHEDRRVGTLHCGSCGAA